MVMEKRRKETARDYVDRIERLRHRKEHISLFNNPSDTILAEVSALSWAIPILEKHVLTTFGYTVPTRKLFYKHEKLDIISDLLKRDGTTCYLCGFTMSSSDMTIDHVQPLAKGGRDEMNNYKLAHDACNQKKGNMTLTEYRGKGW
jgi:HNH endonuclease